VRGTVRRVVWFVADRPVRVAAWARLVRFRVSFPPGLRLVAFFDDTDARFVGRRVVGFLTDAREDAAFFVATRRAGGVRLTDELCFVGCRVVGFLTDAREDAAFFVATRRAGGVRLTDELFFGPAFLLTGAPRAPVVLRGVDDFVPEARPPVLRARVGCRVVTDRARLRPTMLRAPGPGIRLVCSPVFQRTVIIAPFTDVTTPALGPALDVTSTRSPTTAITSSSRKSARVWPERATSTSHPGHFEARRQASARSASGCRPDPIGTEFDRRNAKANRGCMIEPAAAGNEARPDRSCAGQHSVRTFGVGCGHEVPEVVSPWPSRNSPGTEDNGGTVGSPMRRPAFFGTSDDSNVCDDDDGTTKDASSGKRCRIYWHGEILRHPDDAPARYRTARPIWIP